MKLLSMGLALIMLLSLLGFAAADANSLQALLDQKMDGYIRCNDIIEDIQARSRQFDAAKASYEQEDYTNLDKPVQYCVLWLGYTHVTYDSLDFKMTSFDKEYLKAVALNFEKVVERISRHNIDIEVDLHFIGEPRNLTQEFGEGWLYLDQKTVQKDIDSFLAQRYYDTVITTVQSEGAENVARNHDVQGYDKHNVILGLMLAGIEDPIGYSTFLLGEPRPGTYPLKDPEIPSLYATAVAVHEWMHQLEYLGILLDIEYPNTHAYVGESEFPGYKSYRADKNNYDLFEFYELVLEGKLPYKHNGNIKHVGMYPQMWPLIKRNYRDMDRYAIVNDRGEYLAARHTNQMDLPLTLTEEEYLWKLRFVDGDRMVIQSDVNPEYRIDLENAWDAEGNTVKVWFDTGYSDAQSWRVTSNDDGSFCIRTSYNSGRTITLHAIGDNATIQKVKGAPTEAQKWYFYKKQ